MLDGSSWRLICDIHLTYMFYRRPICNPLVPYMFHLCAIYPIYVPFMFHLCYVRQPCSICVPFILAAVFYQCYTYVLPTFHLCPCYVPSKFHLFPLMFSGPGLGPGPGVDGSKHQWNASLNEAPYHSPPSQGQPKQMYHRSGLQRRIWLDSRQILGFRF